MKSKVVHWYQKTLRPAVTLAFVEAMLWSMPAGAVLPTPTAPSTAPAAGDYVGIVKGYGKDAALALGLLIAATLLIWLVWATVAKFDEARKGRAEWGEVGLTALMAGGVAVFGMFLLNEASTVI